MEGHEAATDGGQEPMEGHEAAQDPPAEELSIASVRVTNIDKMATDDELVAHFSAPAPEPPGVKGAEQFANPKHTARVDLEGHAAFERAMGLDGSMLHRRPLKVEPWDDKIFENMSTLERKFASASKPVGRPKLLMKPRTKPMPEMESSDRVASSGAGTKADPFAGAPMQRPRREGTATRADNDADWRQKPSEAEQEERWGFWALLDRCCRRRSPD
mmetsp:Transcript_1150/g.2406  ORF Transcript_1150/g.2406 Transcript_1150/m.2406 type:complete len:216 (-) Transcript_1150:215-862(-)